MTLATVPRYDSDRLSSRDGHAVVIGMSVAGLCAARILADGFDEVTIVERDRLPDEPVARRGVPQGRHPHALLEAGRATLEDLFPGYGEALISDGGLMLDLGKDFHFYAEGDFLTKSPTPMPMFSATRPLFEQVVRQRVSDLEPVNVRAGCQYTGYLVDDTATTVKGVEIRDEDAEEEITADLVVDATGRTSRTPAWLETHGYAPPAVEEMVVDVGYSTAFIERPVDDRRAFGVPPSPPRTRGALIAPVEDGRWIVNLHGMHGDHPPADVEGFKDFAASLPVPEPKQLLEEQQWVSEDINRYRFSSNRRNHYEDLERFPKGLLVIGDAIASFNPVYAQGMSVAALEALLLHHTFATSNRDNLAPPFFDQAAKVVDTVWAISTGGDFKFPQVEVPKPPGTDFFNWYLARLHRRAHTDGRLSDAFFRVLMMEQSPTSLLRPGVMWRVLSPIS